MTLELQMWTGPALALHRWKRDKKLKFLRDRSFFVDEEYYDDALLFTFCYLSIKDLL